MRDATEVRPPYLFSSLYCSEAWNGSVVEQVVVCDSASYSAHASLKSLEGNDVDWLWRSTLVLPFAILLVDDID